MCRGMAPPWHPGHLACLHRGHVGKAQLQFDPNLGRTPCDPLIWQDGSFVKTVTSPFLILLPILQEAPDLVEGFYKAVYHLSLWF